MIIKKTIAAFLALLGAAPCLSAASSPFLVPSKGAMITQEVPAGAQLKNAEHQRYFLDGKIVDVKQGPLRARLLPSTQDGELDVWFRMPRGAVPRITSVSKAYFGEKFSLFPMVENAEAKDGKFCLKYSVTATAPDGAKLEIVKDAKWSGEKKQEASAMICPDVIDLRFDKRYQPGKYSFTLDVVDENSGQKSADTAEVELAKWEAPKTLDDPKLLDEAFRTFYFKPSPELLYSMFFSKALDMEEPRSPYRLNFTMLGFFKAGFLRYDFLVEEIMANFAKYNFADRTKIILISKLIGKPPILDSLLDPSEIKYQKSLFGAEMPNPYEDWHRTLAPVQMDMLWGEFYMTGSYRPVRRMMNTLANAKEGEFVESIMRAGRRPNKDELNRFTMGVVHIVGLKSLIRNTEDSDLADQYCVWALENDDLPKPSQELLRKIYPGTGKKRSQFEKAFEGIIDTSGKGAK